MVIQIQPSIWEELWLLCGSFLLGSILMTGYSLFLILRVWIPHKGGAVVLEDILFWTVAAGAIFALLFLLNEGALRFYALASTGAGMSLSYRFIGKKVTALAEKCKAKWKKVLHKP